FVTEQVEKGVVQLKWVPGTEQTLDQIPSDEFTSIGWILRMFLFDINHVDLAKKHSLMLFLVLLVVCWLSYDVLFLALNFDWAVTVAVQPLRLSEAFASLLIFDALSAKVSPRATDTKGDKSLSMTSSIAAPFARPALQPQPPASRARRGAHRRSESASASAIERVVDEFRAGAVQNCARLLRECARVLRERCAGSECPREQN
ncbi:MAG: hypothetical protein P4M11_07155, partial [Candidatus Pacebacteria bacterium]|nr:hypothetical protein [Candidatus Paceibacterota bacterium]